MHGSLMNVSAIREGERKRMKRERLEGGEEGGIPEHKATRGGCTCCTSPQNQLAGDEVRGRGFINYHQNLNILFSIVSLSLSGGEKGVQGVWERMEYGSWTVAGGCWEKKEGNWCLLLPSIVIR